MISIRLTFSDKFRAFMKGFWPLIIPLFLILGPILFIFGGGTDSFLGLQFQYKHVEKARGYITNIIETKITNNDESVYLFEYTFPVELETVYGNSYSSELGLDVGQKVPIEYISSNPNISRIPGSHLTQSPILAFVGLALILVAIAIVPFRIRKVKMMTKLLGDANIISAVLDGTRKTGIEINEEPLYEMKYLYTIDNKPYWAYYRTTDPDDMDNQLEVIHSNRDHANALLLYALPESILTKIEAGR